MDFTLPSVPAQDPIEGSTQQDSLQFTAVLVASGSSQRMGFDKLASPLAGQSVLTRSFLRLASHPQISHLILVSTSEREELLREELAQLSPAPKLCPWHRCTGGAQRQDSVLAGLQACPEQTDFVLVHDAARPLLSEADLSACIGVLQDSSQSHQAAVLAAPVVDSLLLAEPAKNGAGDNHGHRQESKPALVDKPQSREGLWAAQTPQCFAHQALQEALLHCKEKNKIVTDEVAAARAMGIPIVIVPAQDPNFKLTSPQDFILAQALLSKGMR